MSDAEFVALEQKVETDTVVAIKDLLEHVLTHNSAAGSVTKFAAEAQEAIDKWLVMRDEGRAR